MNTSTTGTAPAAASPSDAQLMDFLMPLECTGPDSVAYDPEPGALLDALLPPDLLAGSAPQTVPAYASLEEELASFDLFGASGPEAVPFECASLEEALLPFEIFGDLAPTEIRMPWELDGRGPGTAAAAGPGAPLAAPLGPEIPEVRIDEGDRMDVHERHMAEQLRRLGEQGLGVAKADRELVRKAMGKPGLLGRLRHKEVPLDLAQEARDRLEVYATARRRFLREAKAQREYCKNAATHLKILDAKARHVADRRYTPEADFNPARMFVTARWASLAEHFRPVAHDFPGNLRDERMPEELKAVLEEVLRRGETSPEGLRLIKREHNRMERIADALQVTVANLTGPTNGLEHVCSQFDEHMKARLPQS